MRTDNIPPMAEWFEKNPIEGIGALDTDGYGGFYNTAGGWASYPGYKEAGTGVVYNPPMLPMSSHIWVNREGKRFMNEGQKTRHTRAHIPVLDWDADNWDYPNSPFWMVFDANFMQNQRIGLYGSEVEDDPIYDAPILSSWNAVHEDYLWSPDNSVELEKGWIVSADTLEELGAKMTGKTWTGEEGTVDGEGLAATVKAYNAACEAGEDPEFNRPAERLIPMGEGPYYAIEMCPAAMYANGGPKVDVENRALNNNNEPIGRLYAAGQFCGPSFSATSSAPNVLITGMLTGRTVAALDSWE